MSELIIGEPLASRLREAAEKDNFTPEEMLSIWLDRYHPAPRPDSSLTDADIDVPNDVQDKAAYRAAARALAPKLYRIARRYWARVEDKERLALTDEELDKQFWLIDQDGVPRLKSDKGAFERSSDPLQSLIGLVETSESNLSLMTDEAFADKSNHDDGDTD